WAYENPFNNRSRTPIHITYAEPDLQVTNVKLPTGLHSGDSATVTFTVSNTGTRDTRQSGWTDAIFLSRDPSLDNRDTELAAVGQGGVLKMGDSYTATATVRIPDGFQGNFYLLIYP